MGERGESLSVTRRSFAPFHRADRNFFLLTVALIWLGILMGFVPEMMQREPNFPAMVHIHGLVFVSWLVLLTVQILLIRSRRIKLHMTLGLLGAMLAGAMIVVGPITAVVADYWHYGTKDYDPAFLAIQWGDIAVFAPLAIAAILLRENPSAHKRLILLATIFISDAGFARWLGDDFKFAGNGMWGQYLQLYVFDGVLVAMLGIYDYATRRRLHPVFVIGAFYGVAMDIAICWLYVMPGWKPVAEKLIGR